MKTYYQLLSIQENAGEHDIIAAYRLAIRKYHPDLHPDNVSAAKLVRHLNRAREVLCDPIRREKYDEYLERRRASKVSPNNKSATHETTVVREKEECSSEAKNEKQAFKKSAFPNEGSSFPERPSSNSNYPPQPRRGRRRQPNVVTSLAGIVFGGVGGIMIGLILVWRLWGTDPLGLANFDIQRLLVRDRTDGALGQEEVTSNSTFPVTIEPSISSGPESNLLERAAGPIGGRSEGVLEPSEELEKQPKAVATVEPRVEVNVPPLVEQKPTAVGRPELTSRVIEAIPALSNSSRSTSFQVPTNAVNVRVGFFGKDATNDSLPRTNPGYNGVLKVNGNMIVAFARKYKWKGDGKWYTLAYVHDGRELNSRDPNMPKTGWYDITQFVQPGEQCKIDYKNGQRSPVGVRVLFQLSTDSKPTLTPPSSSL
ncbi:MAG: J domain-containing protein [Pirellulaceae bacterium]|jgi:hypothetical protein